jgi:DNA-binding beta-propeller fold protein YncE
MQQNKGKLVILGVLIIALAIVGLLLSRKANQTTPIAGTSFNLMTTIYDLRTPLGVAVDGEDKIYVSNTGESQVQVYDSSGALLYKLGTVTDDQGQEFKFYSPYGIAIDDDNNKVYIADYQLGVFDKDGKLLYKLTPPPESVDNTSGLGTPRPNQIALYKDKVFVTSRDGIYVFDKNGKYITRWGSRGSAVGQYDFPNGIGIDKNSGNIFVADTNNSRLVSLTQDGKIRWVIGAWEDAKIGSPFHLLRSVAVGPDGLVYVSDVPDRVLVLDQDGNLKAVIGERGTEDAQLNFPEGIAVSDSNKLYIADRENNRVQVWQLTSDMPLPDNAEVEKFKKANRKFEGMGAAGSNTTATTATGAAGGQ